MPMSSVNHLLADAPKSKRRPPSVALLETRARLSRILLLMNGGLGFGDSSFAINH